MAATSRPLVVLELPYRWAGTEGTVEVEITRNEDPAFHGCAEFARGFPVCRATLEPPARGYADALGWVQLLDHSEQRDPGFEIDLFTPLGESPHPFGFFGFAPAFFDAPHTTDPNWDFFAHTFLCGIGGTLFDEQRDIRAVLGFSWGFRKQGEKFECLPLEAIGPQAWNGHRDYLSRRFPSWSFAEGYREDPLER